MDIIPESLLEKLSWLDFSIQTDRDANDSILILICKDQQQKDGLYNMLANYTFEFLVIISDNDTYAFSLEFSKANRAIVYLTGFTPKEYSDLRLFDDKKINLITAGMWFSEEIIADYYKPLIPFSPKIIRL